jgi:hypothetical protein
MRTAAVAALVGVALGALLGWWVGGTLRAGPRAGAPPSPAASVATPAAPEPGVVDRLRAELERERARGAALADEVEVLEALLAEMGEASDERARQGGAARHGAGGATRAGPRAGDDAGDEEPWFDPGALEGLGYSPGEVERLREAWEASVLERLELDNERMRAGETGMRYALRDAIAVQRRLRERVGDDDYDALLFAVGDPNRVVVSQMLERSPGAAAGLEAGDEVISYGGQRVFRPIELKALTAAGRLGESVEMRVLRDGDVVRVFVERGPLGVQLRTESSPPVR